MPNPYNSRNEFALRGGSLRKIGKAILTRAPALASTSILALGALLCFDATSRAGECIEQTDTPARYICSGALDGESDVTQRQEAGSGEQLVVTQTGPFGVSVSDGNALELHGSSDSTGINAAFEATLRTTGEDGNAGIFLEHNGIGDVYLANSGGGINAQGDGIRVEHNGTGALSVALDDAATVTSATGYGIYAKTTNTEDGATGGVDISVGGDIGTEDAPTGKHGIALKHEGRGDANITLSQNMHLLTKGRGVSIETAEHTGGINLRTDASISSAGEGIRIHHQGTGDVRLDVAGEVLASVNANLGEESIDIHTSRNSGGVDLNISGNVYSTGYAVDINPEGTGDVSVRVAEGSVVHSQHMRAIFIESDNEGAARDIDVHIAGSVGTRTHYTGHDGIAIFVDGAGDVSATLAASGSIFSERQGIDIETNGTMRDVTVRAYGDITSNQNGGIVVAHEGTGPLNITSGNITGPQFGIHAIAESESNSHLNEINIRATGNIASDRYAIRALQYGVAGLNITTESGTTLTSQGREVIAARAYENNTDSMNITIGGDVVATGADPADAVRAYSSGAGDINITVARGANVQGRQGIVATRDRRSNYGARPRSENLPRGTVHIDIDGRVQGETAAINMDAGRIHRLTLRTNSQIIGNITSATSASAFIVLDDSIDDGSHGSLDLGDVSGFSRLYKKGTQDWNLTGDMDEDRAFTLVTHNEGNMFLDDFALLTAPESSDGTSVLVGHDASLFVRGDNGRIEGNVRNNGRLTLSQTGSIRGNLSNSGTLEVDGNNRITGNLTGAGTVAFQRKNEDASLAVEGDFETGGIVILNFSPTSGYTNTLDIQGELTGTKPTRVEIYVSGHVPSDFGDIAPFITAPTPESSTDGFSGDENNEIDSGVIEHAESFTYERLIAGAFTFDFEHDSALEGWALQHSGFSPRVPVFKIYPASLVQLARLSSTQERPGSRVWFAGEGRGFWAKPEGAHTNLEPSDATVKSNYEIYDKRVRFGLDVPLGRDALYGLGRGLRLGANVSLGSADTDVAAIENNESDGSIGTDLLTFSLDAQWTSPEGFYSDAQAQYTTFSSDITAQQESMMSNNDARAFNLSGELGYRFDVRGFSLVPQARVEWIKVRFDEFLAPHNEIVYLEDGEVVDGRIGLTLDKQWSGASQNRVNLSAGAHLRAPFDGRTATNVSGVHLVSELKDAALDINIGFDYQWGDNIFIADLATIQGSEIEDYRASLSARFAF